MFFISIGGFLMKRLFKLCTIGGIALVIAACGNGEEEADTSDEAATEESRSAEGGPGDSVSDEEEIEDADAESENGSEETESDASDEEQSKTFVMEEEGFMNELVYYHIDDEVQRQTSESEITYEALAVENEDEARSLLEKEAVDYSSVDGVEHSIEYGGDGITETLEVDYTVANLGEIANLEGAEFDEEAEDAQFISMEQSEEQLVGAGYEPAEGE